MLRSRFLILLLPFVLLSWAGCDAFSNDSVQGRVIDSATGQPVDVGDVGIQVNGATAFALFPRELASGIAALDGTFAFSDLEATPVMVHFEPSGEVEYPGVYPTGRGTRDDEFRDAYYDVSVDARSNLGTIEIHPTCATLGDISLSRAVGFDEFLVLRMVSVPDAPLQPGSETVVYERDALDSVRLLSVGGRGARLEWTLRGRNQEQEERASGSVQLPTCPRHEVVEYQATLSF